MTLTPFLGILSASILAGGAQTKEAPPFPMEKRQGWTEERVVRGATSQKKLLQKDFILKEELLPDSSPGQSRATLYERNPVSGDLRRLAERVEGALKAPDGMLFFVQDGNLFVLKGDNPQKLLDRSTADLTFDNQGQTIALVRTESESDATAIDLVTREGSVLRRLVDSEHFLWLPIFTPDGKTLVYLSSQTGYASFWRVDLDGSNRRQITNQNIQSSTGGVFSQEFVPAAERRESMRFITSTVLEFESGPNVWQLDVETGQAHRVRTLEEQGGLP